MGLEGTMLHEESQNEKDKHHFVLLISVICEIHRNKTMANSYFWIINLRLPSSGGICNRKETIGNIRTAVNGKWPLQYLITIKLFLKNKVILKNKLKIFHIFSFSCNEKIWY